MIFKWIFIYFCSFFPSFFIYFFSFLFVFWFYICFLSVIWKGSIKNIYIMVYISVYWVPFYAFWQLGTLIKNICLYLYFYFGGIFISLDDFLETAIPYTQWQVSDLLMAFIVLILAFLIARILISIFKRFLSRTKIPEIGRASCSERV